MPTFKLTLAYDGTDFVGWQRQASGVSIQGLLEEACAALDERPVPVVGAGRTDAGVHALGQVASVTIAREIGAEGVVRALNARLPETVRVIEAAVAPDTFNARFDARVKTYRYRVWNAPVLSPFERRYAWHISGPALDVEQMDAAARLIEGRHDFAALQAGGSDVATTVRTIRSSRVTRDAALVTYEVSGEGFLRYMVRNTMGTLVEIGRGRRGTEWVGDVLASRDRAEAGATAPAHGLFLVRVGYD